MAKIDYQFADFLMAVSDSNKDFVTQIHETLTQDGYKIKIEPKAIGFLIIYAHPKNKRSILNFVFRKSGMYIRLYGENCNKYADVLNRLPDSMVKQIEKSSMCKRFTDPQACYPSCPAGYDFFIGEKHFQKCRLFCFLLLVDGESAPLLLEMVEREKEERG